MTRAWAGLLVWVLAAGLLVGCGRSKEDLVQKSRGVGTRAELEQALGKPSDISKLGPVEQWTYKASNGNVVFVIVGDKVTMQATTTPDEKKDQK
ncbi:MAG TPA: hypothetical protein VFX87_03050 [Methylomirabilota bacterium]|nr:hypothetical protein [Methylomirabilota bacterium]